MIRQRACAPVDILCRRDRAVVTTFGRAGIRPAARPRRHFSDTSPALRPFCAQPYTGTAAARQPVGALALLVEIRDELRRIRAGLEEKSTARLSRGDRDRLGPAVTAEGGGPRSRLIV